MSSPSPPSSAHFATGLRPAPAGVRSYTIGSAAYFSAVSLRGLLSHPSASRVPSVSFRQRPSPLAERSRLPSAAQSSGDPGEINVDNAEGTREPLGSSTGSGKNGKESTKSFSSKELLEKLKRYGAAGVLSYGLLNTVYYVTAFLLVWFYFAPAPGRMGYGAAVERFVKLMAMVWAGSQVTKILRAGGALALAPFVDRGLRWFTVKFNFKSEGRAFATVVGFCFAIAAALFFGLTILWA
ncbi:hypothetical protein GQ55_2G271800 [Panicum hallii var. hallii]|uniref:Uncharacterized protein n=2 Tax=Panicum hallii TaxID=206008 RepID=A0A2T7ESU2_9POAL|nr:uncharacterized protein LOC112881412 [Panicum hallii]PAN12655.1 hypothetical protein PAHAL_2G281400 [Panicum hallii]PUZ70889.1 hypothetical protein GQ55_2G271800 [Panicum hallii var. hallii]